MGDWQRAYLVAGDEKLLNLFIKQGAFNIFSISNHLSLVAMPNLLCAFACIAFANLQIIVCSII